MSKPTKQPRMRICRSSKSRRNVKAKSKKKAFRRSDPLNRESEVKHDPVVRFMFKVSPKDADVIESALDKFRVSGDDIRKMDSSCLVGLCHFYLTVTDAVVISHKAKP